MVDGELKQQIAEARAALRARGWTDDELAFVERRWRRGGDDAFVLVMLRLSQDMPPVTPRGDGADDRVLAKIRALLAKAESTTFAAEAEACSAKAQELMTRHRLEGVTACAAVSGPGGRRIWLDEPYLKPKFALVAAVARANGCHAVCIGGDCVHVVGYQRDLDMVETLFTSLLLQAGAAMAASAAELDAYDRSRIRSFRRSFLLGYASRIGVRLRNANETTQQTVDAAQGGSLLPVLRERDEAVSAAVEQLFPRLRSSGGYAMSNAAGWVAGDAAANRADLASDRRSRVRCPGSSARE